MKNWKDTVIKVTPYMAAEGAKMMPVEWTQEKKEGIASVTYRAMVQAMLTERER